MTKTMTTLTSIGSWAPYELAGSESARRYADRAVREYEKAVGDLDFGSEINRGLFVKYLAKHASENDTMRGYYAAFNRRPLMEG